MDCCSQKVSLITTLFNEGPSVLGFLDSYRRQSRFADEFVIVDGGSTDETAEIIEAYARNHPQLNIKLIVDTTCSKKFCKGPIARGRNVAVSSAENEIIAVTDAGCMLDSRWLEEITRPFAEDEADVVSGWYEPYLENDFQKAYARLFLPSLETLDREAFLPSSRSIAFKKEAWSRVGGYPEDTYTAEDTRYDMLLKESGCRFYFNEKAIVYWHCPRNLEEAVKKHYQYGYGDGQYQLFRTNYARIAAGLLFPYKYLFNSNYKNAGMMSYLINLNLVKGYVKGLVAGCNKG